MSLSSAAEFQNLQRKIVSTGKSQEEKEENETERTFSQNFLYKSRGSFKVITDQTRLNWRFKKF